MKQLQVEETKDIPKIKRAYPPPPPPPPPLPRPWATPSTPSVTKQEIAKFWRQKRMVEEDHFRSAIKAAARIKARALTEEDYRRFEESLNDDNGKDDGTNNGDVKKDDENSKEIRVGIKDWWTKSKYAYLNQPAVESKDKPKRSSTYIPNFCYVKASPHQPTYFPWSFLAI